MTQIQILDETEFQTAQIPLGKVYIQLFFLLQRVKSWV